MNSRFTSPFYGKATVISPVATCYSKGLAAPSKQELNMHKRSLILVSLTVLATLAQAGPPLVCHADTGAVAALRLGELELPDRSMI
jgi:hypothetical protein